MALRFFLYMKILLMRYFLYQNCPLEPAFIHNKRDLTDLAGKERESEKKCLDMAMNNAPFQYHPGAVLSRGKIKDPKQSNHHIGPIVPEDRLHRLHLFLKRYQVSLLPQSIFQE